MICGFTGSRFGGTPEQKAAFLKVIGRLRPTEWHHGDCVGWDDQATEKVWDLLGAGCKIVCHPPLDEAHRAYNARSDVSLDPLTHFARNRAIVDACGVLIACPLKCDPIVKGTRGGTAYTVNYARKVGRTIWIVWPDGGLSYERDGNPAGLVFKAPAHA